MSYGTSPSLEGRSSVVAYLFCTADFSFAYFSSFFRSVVQSFSVVYIKRKNSRLALKRKSVSPCCIVEELSLIIVDTSQPNI